MPHTKRSGPVADLPASLLGELNELLWALPSTLDPYAIVGVLLERATRLFHAPLSCVWLKNGEGYELAGYYGFTEKKAEQLKDALQLDGRDRHAIAMSGPELHALAGFGKRRLGGVLALPLQTPGGHVGWMILARLEQLPFSDLEQQFVSMIVSRVAIAIENARLFQETQARRSELELLYEIAQLLVSTVRLDQLLERLVRRMTEAFNLTGCLIRLLDPETNTFRARAMYHRDPEVMERIRAFYQAKALRPGEGRTGQTLELKQPHVARDLLEDPYLQQDDKDLLGSGSLIAAPLMVRGKAIGVMFWYRQGRLRVLTEAMVPLATHLGNQVAIAIDNAQLVQEMEIKIAERTATVVADKEALALQLSADREYVTQLALTMREQTHAVLGMAGLIEMELDKPAVDIERSRHYLETIMTAAERVNGELADLFSRLQDGGRVTS